MKAINLLGVWSCASCSVGGTSVNCSLIGGVVGNPGLAACHAAKHGVISPTQNAARSIRINAVCPGTIKTPEEGFGPGKFVPVLKIEGQICSLRRGAFTKYTHA